jgi:hypothetical protein
LPRASPYLASVLVRHRHGRHFLRVSSGRRGSCVVPKAGVAAAAVAGGKRWCFCLDEGSGGVVLVLLSCLARRSGFASSSLLLGGAGRRGLWERAWEGPVCLGQKKRQEVRNATCQDHDTAAVRLEALQEAERMTHMEEAALRFAPEVKTAAAAA